MAKAQNEASKEAATIEWPDGWFVCENGEVAGPYSTNETFKAKRNLSPSANLMVSRKGFRRWYAMSDIMGIYEKASRGSASAIDGASSIKEIEESLRTEIDKLVQLERTVAAQAVTPTSLDQTISAVTAAVNSAKAAQPDGSDLKADHIARTSNQKNTAARRRQGPVVTKHLEGTVNTKRKAEATAGVSAEKSTSTLSDEQNYSRSGKIGRNSKGMLSKKSEKQESKAKQKISPSKSEVSSKIGSAMSLKNRKIAYNHMMLSGRLRLGPISNPLLEGVAKFVMTLGLYWGFWFRKSVAHASLHLDPASISRSNKMLWLAMIPGYHLVLAHRLGQVIAMMENQNGYRRTSPTLGVVLAICPPLAIIYFQSALNNHWVLHVTHADKSKNG